MKWSVQEIKHNMGKRYVYIVLAVFSLLLFALVYNNVRPKKMNIVEGQLAEETIRANKTIENTEETEDKRQLAEEAVIPASTFDEQKKEEQIATVEQLFKLVSKIKQKAQESYQEKVQHNSGEIISKPTIEEEIAALKQEFEKLNQHDILFYQSLPPHFYETIFSLSDEERSHALTITKNSLDRIMSQHIRTSNLEDARKQAVIDVDRMTISEKEKSVITDLLTRAIVVNEGFNEKKTEDLKKAARDSVAPSMIYQGEVIVQEGVQIDQKAIQKLTLLGMMNETTSIFPIVSLVLLILFQAAVLLYLGKQFEVEHEDKQTIYITFYASLFLINILMIKFLHTFQNESLSYVMYLFPAAFTPLVLTIFISRRLGVTAAIFQVAYMFFIFNDLLGSSSLLMVSIYYIFTGVFATMLRQERIGNQLKKGLVWLVLFPFSFSIVLVTLQGLQFTDIKTWLIFICALAGSLLSFLLSIGLHPYIELLLNDDSLIVLNELSNPNHPLLKQLLTEAPGTYHHSMMVANLSANAVAEIGGRTLLTRVACYYHDIGKIKHANFFVENLPAGAENPHNFLLPKDSKEIIFDHVTEGVKILKEEQMPQLVIDICQQHHGTTLMKYFYVKAKEQDDTVTQDEFRYPGPIPQTREAAVVSIADSAEAAVRAMDHPTNEKIEAFVKNLVKNRIEDGQLDDSGLTLNEIRKVEASIINGLCSTFHSRIKYPKMKEEAEEMKKAQERKDR